MLKNNKTVEDTHATRDIVEAAVGQVQTKRNYGYKNAW